LSNAGDKSGDTMDDDKAFNKRFMTSLLLAVVFSANIGSCGSLSGSEANHVLENLMNNAFGSNIPLTPSTWMLFNIPLMLCNILITGFFLYWYFLMGTEGTKGYQNIAKSADHDSLQLKYDSLPSLNFGGYVVLILTIGVEVFWFMENPFFMPGWKDLRFFHQLFLERGYISRTSLSLGIAIMFFILPRNLNSIKSIWNGRVSEPSKPLLVWEEVVEELHFGLLLLMGGGFALSAGIKESQLDGVILYYLEQVLLPAAHVRHFEVAPAMTVLFCTTMVEFVFDTPLVIILTPLLITIAQKKHINPHFFTVPGGISMAYAFLFPVGNPSVALLFDSTKISKMTLFKTGLVVKILCNLMLLLFSYTYGAYIFYFRIYDKKLYDPNNLY